MTTLSTIHNTEQSSRLFEKAERYFNMVKKDLLSFYETQTSLPEAVAYEVKDALLLKKDEAYRMVVGYIHLICPLAVNKRINEFLNLQEYLSGSILHFELLRYVMNRTEEFDGILSGYLNDSRFNPLHKETGS